MLKRLIVLYLNKARISNIKIMDQYHPDHKARIFPEEYEEILKNVSKEEMERARSYAKEFNIAFEQIS